jgi:hypothetical protein
MRAPGEEEERGQGIRHHGMKIHHPLPLKYPPIYKPFWTAQMLDYESYDGRFGIDYHLALSLSCLLSGVWLPLLPERGWGEGEDLPPEEGLVEEVMDPWDPGGQGPRRDGKVHPLTS